MISVIDSEGVPFQYSTFQNTDTGFAVVAIYFFVCPIFMSLHHIRNACEILYMLRMLMRTFICQSYTTHCHHQHTH